MKYLLDIRDLADTYEGFLLDIWGVIHDGHQIFEGVISSLDFLKHLGKQVVLLSNAPRRAATVEAQLTHLGLPRHLYGEVYSSGEDAYAYISAHKNELGSVCYPLCSLQHGGLLKDLELTVTYELSQAHFILNTGPDNLVLAAHEEFLQEARVLNLPMICVNPDISVIRQGEVILCAGALAERYKELGGRVTYHGKPEPRIYGEALRKFEGIRKHQVVALGDSLRTDILGANQSGLDSGLVMTGLEAQGMNVVPGTLPDISLLEKRCTEKRAYPEYVLARFGIAK